MKRDSFFKFLFYFLSVIMSCLLIGAVAAVIYAAKADPDTPIPFIVIWIIFMLALAAAFVCLALFIYKDAQKRGLPKWMWMTIALFVPNFIGLIIYFVFRNNSEKRCPKCGSAIRYDYNICPYCGHNLSITCNNCNKRVEKDWKVCPYCNTEIKKV